MIAAGHSWLNTLLTVAISSSIGFSAFYYFGDMVFGNLARWRKRPAKRFTKLNRRIIKVKMRYGLLGMGVIAGVISVPLAGLVTAKFFREPSKAIPAMIVAFSSWTLLLTTVSWLIRNVLHG
jgi:membrane protein YqaA with SNARE-associated domain